MGLQDAIAGISGNTTTYILVITALFVVTVALLLFIFRGFVTKFVLKKYVRKERFIERTEGIFVIVMILVGLDIALQRFLFQEELLFRILHTIIVLLFTALTVEISYLLLEVWGGHMTQKKGIEFREEILPVTHSVVKVILSLIALIIILQIWGVQIWTLLASIGIAGLILGLALKDSLENVFAGVGLIFDKTYKAGDIIGIEGAEIGQVVMINLRSTRILTADEKVITIPNSILANSKVVNYSQPSNQLRISVNFSVAPGSDVDSVERIIIEAARHVKNVLQSPSPTVTMAKMDEFFIDFTVDVYTRFTSLSTLEDLKDDLLRTVYAALAKNGNLTSCPTRMAFSVRTSRKK